jgi:sarcosine oxidase
MQRAWDVIVVGVGAVGSAALYQLSRRGVKALGIDRFHPPHDHGSSHGDTRITRLALGEGGEYLQFARRSHEIWRELEAATGATLLREVGCLVYGSTESRAETHGAEDFLATTMAVAREHGISHECLEGAELSRRFPQFRFRGDERACLEHSAGFVHPEACIAAQLESARRSGAEIKTGERVVSWQPGGEGVIVETDRERHAAARLVLCAGAWLPGLVAQLGAQAKVFRQVLHWFGAAGPHDLFEPSRMPTYIRVADAGTAMFYGFPAIDGPGGGMKIAGEQFESTSQPDDVSRDVSSAEMRAMHTLAAPHLRISQDCIRSVVCKYTVTPDFGFVIDRHPECESVWLASACSGHGFKHSAAVGEALAEAVTQGGSTSFDLSAFRLQRLLTKAQPSIPAP